MTVFRRHLRLCVAAWIAFQAVSLSAFVPRDCCAAHRVPAAQDQETGPTCHHAQAPRESLPECGMRGTCNGPLAVLAALLSPHGVLAEHASIDAIAVETAPARRNFESPRPLSHPPDSPPPRS